MNKQTLKASLLFGAVFFLLIALAHLFGTRIPGLYIYYDKESFRFQDLIISALSFGWSVHFLNAYFNVNRPNMISILISGIVAIAILTRINNSENAGTIPRMETALLFLYWCWLAALNHQLRKSSRL
jgi:hypothetical protein